MMIVLVGWSFCIGLQPPLHTALPPMRIALPPAMCLREPRKPGPILDFRRKHVLHVASTVAETVAEVTAAPPARTQRETKRYRLRRRDRGQQHDDGAEFLSEAAALDDLSLTLATFEEKDTFYLSQEVSLQSAATEIWMKLGDSLGERNDQLEEAAGELGAAVRALGRVAQASLTGAHDVKARNSREWELAVAGARAQRAVKAVEKLASSCAEAADDVLVAGGGLRRLDKGWRRDALKANLALERAPDHLERELRRQRLRKLTNELATLGLDDVPLLAITEARVRAARAARAKALHPDVARTGRRIISGLMGIATSEQTADASRAHDAMSELNAAHDAVRRAITAPMYQ